MLSTVVLVFLAVASVVTVVVFVASCRVGDAQQSAEYRAGLSIVAGLLWPVLLLGLVELSSVVVLAKTYEYRGARVGAGTVDLMPAGRTSRVQAR